MEHQRIDDSHLQPPLSVSENTEVARNWFRLVFIYMAAVIFALVCGPVGTRLTVLLKTCPLPRSCSPLIEATDFVGFFLLTFGSITSLFCMPIGAVASLFAKGTRKYAPVFIIMSVVAWASWPLNWRMAPLKNWGMRNAIDAAQPLIAAIDMYKTDYGFLPEDLEQLKPEYIDTIPYTRMVGYPEFYYSKRRSDSTDALFRDYEIGINTSIGILNWDCFVYWPEEVYPREMYGGWVERIDVWAYVHE